MKLFHELCPIIHCFKHYREKLQLKPFLACTVTKLALP